MKHRQNFLRERDGEEAKVSNAELFFDLVYVFSITQLSHYLLHNLTALGAVQTLILWFAVWLGWQYACWATNWLEPENLAVRAMIFTTMFIGLIMAASLPYAFSNGAVIFASCYAALEVGRTLFILFSLGRKHELTPNYQRMFSWVFLGAIFWITGIFYDGSTRMIFWTLGIACEYVSPMFGYWVPGLGRSTTKDWTIEGGHLAERCQLIVIVALGESVLVTGATLSAMKEWDIPRLIAFTVMFLGSLAMWWMYFDTSSKDGSKAIRDSNDQGRMGAKFHYVHVILLAGIIVSAVADALIIAHPDGKMTTTSIIVLLSGPALYIVGNAFYKKIVYGVVPRSHYYGLAALIVLFPFSYLTDLLMVGGLATVVLIAVAVLETLRVETAA